MIVAIIQARMGSTRLRSKSLADVCGKPLLAWVVERTAATVGLDRVIVATTDRPEDDQIKKWGRQANTHVYRGSADDVLDRYAKAARLVNASVVMRVTADEPLIDPEVCGSVLRMFLETRNIDYVSNAHPPSFPDGLDVEVFSADALFRSHREATWPSEREHVTPYMYGHPDKFALRNLQSDENLSALRWTVDYAQDLEFVRAIVSRLENKPTFGYRDILELIAQEPKLQDLNRTFDRDEGYRISLKNEGRL